jgi:hypothetical protein
MPTDGAGVYTLPSGYLATLGQVIQPSQHNPPLEDVATGLTNRLTRNGSGSMTADLNFGGNRGTNIAAASAGTDAVQLNQADARYSALSAAETTIASASTVDLATATNYRVAVTGTTTITSFGAGLNQNRQVRFVASLTITHNATTLICPNAASIITAAGDVAICQSDGSGNWRIVQYFRAAVDGVSVTWTDIASAATMDVGAVATENLRVTGTTTVTSLGTAASGVTRTLRAAAAFTLTHSANIICPASQNIVLAANDLVRVASLGAGVWVVTDKTLAFDDTRLNGVPFTKIYTSAQQTYTIGGSLTLAHGLGEVPKFAFVIMRCTTADHGYSIGDEFFWVGHTDGDGSAGRCNPPLIIRDGTNLNIRFAQTFFRLPLKSTNDNITGTPTPANWRAIFVAVA